MRSDFSLNSIIPGENPPLSYPPDKNPRPKHCSTYLNRLIIIYNTMKVPSTLKRDYSLEHKKRYNIVIGKEKDIYVLQQVVRRDFLLRV